VHQRHFFKFFLILSSLRPLLNQSKLSLSNVRPAQLAKFSSHVPGGHVSELWIEMGPCQIWAYFWPAVNRRQTHLWIGYFWPNLIIFFWPVGKKLKNFRFSGEILAGSTWPGQPPLGYSDLTHIWLWLWWVRVKFFWPGSVRVIFLLHGSGQVRSDQGTTCCVVHPWSRSHPSCGYIKFSLYSP